MKIHEVPEISSESESSEEERGEVFCSKGFRMRVNHSDLVIVTGSLVNLHFPLSVGQDYSQGMALNQEKWAQQLGTTKR